MDRLGVAEAIRAKVKYYPEGQTAMEAMDKGEVALGIGQISEIVPVQGVTLVGPIPENLQLKTIYAAAVASKGSSQVLAQKFLAYVTGPKVRASLKTYGFDPGS
jgi:molybdate transport system substrate-binding protein